MTLPRLELTTAAARVWNAESQRIYDELKRAAAQYDIPRFVGPLELSPQRRQHITDFIFGLAREESPASPPPSAPIKLTLLKRRE